MVYTKTIIIHLSVGESGGYSWLGKYPPLCTSTLVNKSVAYIAGFFSPNYKLTIGVDFALKVIYWDETTKINLQLWYVVLLYFQWELKNQHQTNDPGYKQTEHFK